MEIFCVKLEMFSGKKLGYLAVSLHFCCMFLTNISEEGSGLVVECLT